MVETSGQRHATTRERRLGVRQRHVTPSDATLARTSGAPFWALAFFLVLGIGIAVVLAARGYNGPGLLTQQQAFTATGLALFTIAAVLLIFLGTIAFVFGEVRRLRSVGEERETRRIADVNRQEGVNRQLREEVAALRQREHLLVAELSKRRSFAAGADEEGHHVIELEGVGPRYATRMNTLGIITTNQLVAADAEELARRIEASPEQVREWQAMGRLLQIKGIGPQWAEALARIGVTGREDLARRSPHALAAAIAELNRGPVRVTGSDPSPARAARWVRAAGGDPPPLQATPSASGTRRVAARRTVRRRAAGRPARRGRRSAAPRRRATGRRAKSRAGHGRRRVTVPRR